MEEISLDTSTILEALQNDTFQSWDKKTQWEALKVREDNKDLYSASILELIVNNDLVSKIPHDILNKDNIVFKDDSGEVLNGLLHLCATNDNWQNLPKHLFCEENLLVQNFWGNTPIQEAIVHGSYNFVIENLDNLSEKTFVDVNRDNDTTLELLLSTKIGRNPNRPPFENKEDILPKILEKFNPDSLKKYYKYKIKDNPDIDSKDKNIFKRFIAMPLIKKLSESEQYLEI
jgi:hypothetical protein